MNPMELQAAYDRFAHEGMRLAGGLGDLAQRAAVYHHVFQDSGQNHVFPLIAAHGALWARGYFAFGLRLARWLSWQYAFDSELRRRQMAAVEAFANVLRDINRRVCADTYAGYHFAAIYGQERGAEHVVAAPLLEALNRVHAARRRGHVLPDQDKLAVFRAHFINEQDQIVGPTIAQAAGELHWPLVRSIALQPIIRFAYFPTGERLWFGDFSNRAQRVANGLRAFELAASCGWQKTADMLADYAVLPSEFFVDSTGHFAEMRNAVLALR